MSDESLTPHERHYFHGVWFRLTRGGLEFDLQPAEIATFLKDSTNLERAKLAQIWEISNLSGGPVEKDAFFTLLRIIACFQMERDVDEVFQEGNWNDLPLANLNGYQDLLPKGYTPPKKPSKPPPLKPKPSFITSSSTTLTQSTVKPPPSIPAKPMVSTEKSAQSEKEEKLEKLVSSFKATKERVLEEIRTLELQIKAEEAVPEILAELDQIEKEWSQQMASIKS